MTVNVWRVSGVSATSDVFHLLYFSRNVYARVARVILHVRILRESHEALTQNEAVVTAG